MVTVAVDAMGGDHGLAATVAGVARLSREAAGLHMILVGDAAEIAAALRQLPYDPTHLTVAQASGCVAMDASPAAALEAAPTCSILRAVELVREGHADAVVSAGNTGATILAAARTFQLLPGIRRSALAAVYPTERRHGPKGDPFALMLDVGATLQAGPEDLIGFAVMGSAYSSIISEIAAPRVALLSNGAEANKGTPAIIEAHRRLASGSLNFTGNVEGLDIPKGVVDVIVCDGFLGNVVLKMLEGVSDVFSDVVKKASSRSLQWRMGVAMLGDGLRELRSLTDWKTYGGAPLLGFDKVVIKAHGRSEALAIRNAVKVAAKAVRGDLAGRIADGVRAVGGAGGAP